MKLFQRGLSTLLLSTPIVVAAIFLHFFAP